MLAELKYHALAYARATAPYCYDRCGKMPCCAIMKRTVETASCLLCWPLRGCNPAVLASAGVFLAKTAKVPANDQVFGAYLTHPSAILSVFFVVFLTVVRVLLTVLATKTGFFVIFLSVFETKKVLFVALSVFFGVFLTVFETKKVLFVALSVFVVVFLTVFETKKVLFVALSVFFGVLSIILGAKKAMFVVLSVVFLANGDLPIGPRPTVREDKVSKPSLTRGILPTRLKQKPPARTPFESPCWRN